MSGLYMEDTFFLMNGTPECTVSNLRVRRDEAVGRISPSINTTPTSEIFAAGYFVLDRKTRMHLAAASIHRGANFSEIGSVGGCGPKRDGP